MTSNFDHETNHVEDEYYGEEDEDDLDDFIVYSDDDEDRALKKQKHQRQQEEEEEEEVQEESSEEEEEAPAGTQEIVSLREQLKDKIRRKNAAMAGTSFVKQTRPTPAKDKFGTFFGPSWPVLAPRVIQEGCSTMMKELQGVPSRKDVSLVSKTQPGTSSNLQKPKIISEEKRKVDALRENRDYSSLFSDDAEDPPTKEQPDNRKPDVQVRVPVNSAGKYRAPNGQPARSLANGHGLKGAGTASQSKAGSPGKAPLADRKRTVATGRNGSTPPAMKKTTGSQPALKRKRPQALLPGQRQQQSSHGQKLPQALQSQRLQSNGHQQIRMPASTAQGQRSGQNGSPHDRAKPAQKQLVASSKLKVSRPVEKRAVKRKSDDEVDYESISKHIGAIFNYNRFKYAGMDEDDSNMEADYASIQKEERRSAKLARQEDQEQLRLIEEEERRERAKKRKKPALTQE
ncbi:hypothetical protein EJB05_20332 [Eragrostis curvula]|uniref:SPT2 chromatin protein n=1 Tax=Eragrostis curvula TaxID=38414 RepID=A0A5J9UY67_9POAL|nr:hypothetical protein EJB05_20332 [Eragrostis curvula]